MTVSNAGRIAFFRFGTFSHINSHVESILRTNFPDHPLDTIEIDRLIRSRKGILLLNLFYLFNDYRLRLADAKQVRKSFFRTTYLFRQVKKLATERLAQRPYLFSFQTQSLFDTSRPATPHFVYTDHSILSNLDYPGVSHEDIDALYPPTLIQLEKNIYQNATLVFTMGQFVAHNIIQRYGCPSKQVRCVGGGSNTISGAKCTSKDYTAKSILFVGMDWERKGGADLVDSFLEIRKIFPETTLTIVGCEPRLNLPNCREVGPVPIQSMKPYFDTASVFCLPSKREPFGVALVEASMAQLPVVSTAIGAIPEIIRHEKSGFLVMPGDTDGLTAALHRLLSSPDLCLKFGRAGRNHVEHNFTWKNVGDKMTTHMTNAISCRSRRESAARIPQKFVAHTSQ